MDECFFSPKMWEIFGVLLRGPDVHQRLLQQYLIRSGALLSPAA
jgi:hypothetical protein